MNDMRKNSTDSAGFLPGDVIFFASKGDLPGRLGKWIARSRGEHPTDVVHTAQFLDRDTILELDYRAKTRAVDLVLQGERGFEVWRCQSLTAYSA